jgi:GT2 family glycosyltransferase
MEFPFNEKIPVVFPFVSFYSTGKNLGYTGGTNYGIKKALEQNPKYILLLNNDTLAEPDFLDRMVDEMEINKKAAASCGMILAEHDKKTIWYAGGKLIHWRGLAVHTKKGKFKELLNDFNCKDVDFITGCMLLLRSEFLLTIGLEDERYYMYLDDIEFSFRIKTMGYSLLYVPAAVIYHKILGETESSFKLYYSVRNRLLLINQINKGVMKIISTLYFITVISAKIVFWKIFNYKFYKAARLGIRDYRKKNFYQGNGMKFISNYNN